MDRSGRLGLLRRRLRFGLGMPIPSLSRRFKREKHLGPLEHIYPCGDSFIISRPVTIRSAATIRIVFAGSPRK